MISQIVTIKYLLLKFLLKSKDYFCTILYLILQSFKSLYSQTSLESPFISFSLSLFSMLIVCTSLSFSPLSSFSVFLSLFISSFLFWREFVYKFRSLVSHRGIRNIEVVTHTMLLKEIQLICTILYYF